MFLLRLIILLLFFAVIFHDAEASDRNKIRFFKYYNADHYPSDFNDFLHSIRRKIGKLAERPDLSEQVKDVFSDIDIDEAQARIGGELVWVENSSTKNELHEYWRRHDTVIQIFHGRIESAGSVRLAKSYAFFGSLNHTLSRDTIPIELEISGDQHDTNRDSHSAVILYAVLLSELELIGQRTAIDCSKADLARSLMSAAHDSALNVATQSNEMKELRDAIRQLGSRIAQECSG